VDKRKMRIRQLPIFVVALAMIFIIGGATTVSGATIVTKQYWVLTDGYKGDFTNGGYITVTYGNFLPYITDEIYHIDYWGTGGQLQKYDASGNLMHYGYRWQTGSGFCVVYPPGIFFPSTMENGRTYNSNWTREEYNDNNFPLGNGSDNIAVTVTGPETVIVPAGTFTTYKFRIVDNWTNSSGVSGTSISEYWLAKNTGWIKLNRGGKTHELSRSTPTAITGSATSITASSATLGGTVNPHAVQTTVNFQYGTTASYGSITTSKSAGSGKSTVSANASITGLNPSTTYHFRIKASNSLGTSYGDDKTFTTDPLFPEPTVTTGSATSVTAVSVTLNGTVNPNGGSTDYHFEYGTTTSYGSTTTSTSAGSETSEISVDASLTGLYPNTTYHYRVVATNSTGTSYGDDENFTTNSSVTIRIPADYATIQAGIDAASDGDTVLVADGTYTGEGNKNLDFKGKAITVQSQNGPAVCIIDCEGDGRGFYFQTAEGKSSVVFGFTISNGNPGDASAGGIACVDGASPSIINCVISNNSCSRYGGGIWCFNSSPTITRCRFNGNTAGYRGGAIYCDMSSPVITNCIFYGNTATHWGGAIGCDRSSSPTVTNCTINKNTAGDDGGGFSSQGSSTPAITNCILWDNSPGELWAEESTPTVSYSDVKEGYSGEGNINSDPLFMDESGNDYHLSTGSPCIGKGTSEGAPTIDFRGGKRPQGTGYDMGAYEYVIGPFATGSPLPDTGQTQSYTQTFGEDSDYLINQPSYTKLDADGIDLTDSATDWAMVRDNVTGLIWEVKTDDGSIHDGADTYSWQDAQDVFISALNTTGFGGYSDWRLPSIKELTSIVNRGLFSPAINSDYFPSTMPSNYWSSTVYASNSIFAWQEDFENGNAGNDNKSTSYYVRAVRGEQPASLGSLTTNTDSTVTDTSAGLMWQQKTPGPMNWEGGLSYCEALTLGGYTDWRLPNINELQSIVDYSKNNPATDTDAFPGTFSSKYWTSTSVASETSMGWQVFFYDGDVITNTKSTVSYVRAVRGGQNQVSGNLLITTPAQGSSWDIGSLMPITWETRGISGNVTIYVSRQGGKEGSFETIFESTENDGSYNWIVDGDQSVNCVLKIVPADDSSRETTQGLFSIISSIIYVEAGGLSGSNTPCYLTVQAAIDNASTGATIKIARGSYNEDINQNTSKILNLQGGYDSTFTTQSSNMTIKGSMVIGKGKVTVRNVAIHF